MSASGSPVSAMRVNDEIVQLLVSALWAWDLGEMTHAHSFLEEALTSSKEIVEGLLEELEVAGELLPGALRNGPGR